MCVEGITLHHYVKMADLGSFVIRVRGNGEETCFRLEKKKKKKRSVSPSSLIVVSKKSKILNNDWVCVCVVCTPYTKKL